MMVEDVRQCGVCGEYDYACSCGGDDWKARALAAEKEASDLRAEIEGLTAKRDHYRAGMNAERKRADAAVVKLVKVRELCEDEQRIPERRELIVLHSILAILDSTPMVARVKVCVYGGLPIVCVPAKFKGRTGDHLLIVKEES